MEPSRPDRCLLLASLRSNHAGNPETAARLVESAREAGADGIVLERRTAEQAAVRQVLDRPSRKYHALGSTYRKALERLDLAPEAVARICERAGGLKMKIYLAPYDLEALEQSRSWPKAGWKIPASVATHSALVSAASASGASLIASVSGCSEREATDLVSVLPAGSILLHELADPRAGREIQEVAYLASLRRFGFPVGYADAARKPLTALLAVAMGAQVVEKPITLERESGGPDSSRSLIPSEFREMAQRIRELEAQMRSPTLRDPAPEEMDRLDWDRPSIVAACRIPKGTEIREEMLALKPPFRSLAPRLLPELVGRRARYDIAEDEHLTMGMIE